MTLPRGRRAREGAGPAWRPRPAWLWMLAVRRQRHQETAKVPSDVDTTERRAAELYIMAVEQLGSDKAQVRFGGLHALERLAQDNPGLRQAIVNIICAYLRIPFSATAPGPAEGQKGPGAERATGTDGIGGTWEQERQVRLTAQRILTEHLHHGRARDQRSADLSDSRFWNNIHLDLTAATLIDFNLVDGAMTGANFRRAAFCGDATFSGTAFSGDAQFGGAAFSRDASFSGASFGGDARFSGAAFSGDALFGGAAFSGDAQFGETTFTGDALFAEAAFSRGAGFRRAAFGGEAEFRRATFTGDAGFDKATFGRSAWFGEAAFTGDAGFRKAAFTGDAGFDKVTFGRGASFDGAAFTSDAWFGETTFSRGASFDRVVFSSDAWFGEATFTGDAGFGEASFTGDAWFYKVTFGRSASFGEAAFNGDAGFGRVALSGRAWFSETTFRGGADALHFEQARILSPGASHVWPAGWRLVDADGDGYMVVRASDNGGS
jgi:Pentapeptide repeats (9 copies)